MINTGPEKFLTLSARRIIAQQGGNLGHVTAVMPNNRSCIYLKEAFQNCADKNLRAPRILSLQNWIVGNSELTLCSPLEQLVELYHVYRMGGGTESMDEFFPTGRIMLLDFDEIDRQMTDAKSSFTISKLCNR